MLSAWSDNSINIQSRPGDGSPSGRRRQRRPATGGRIAADYARTVRVRCGLGGPCLTRGASGSRTAVANRIRRRVRMGRVAAPVPNPAARLKSNRRGPKRLQSLALRQCVNASPGPTRLTSQPHLH